MKALRCRVNESNKHIVCPWMRTTTDETGDNMLNSLVNNFKLICGTHKDAERGKKEGEMGRSLVNHGRLASSVNTVHEAEDLYGAAPHRCVSRRSGRESKLVKSAEGRGAAGDEITVMSLEGTVWSETSHYFLNINRNCGC